MILKNLSFELAAAWARDLLISGWTMGATLEAIRQLDHAKPLQRRMMIVRWELPMPRVEDDPLVDDDGNELLHENGRRKRRGTVGDGIADSARRLAVTRGLRSVRSAEERSIRREEALRTNADAVARREQRRLERAAAAWAEYDAGLRKSEPRANRPGYMPGAAYGLAA